MAISVKLEAFEGPLDLLLHLIEKNKVDIYDIPIAMIADQYMEYIHAMEEADLGVMSEFLVMGATLLDIKCRMLLPKEVDEEGEEIDPRDELVQQLVEYKLYKYMSYELRDLKTLNGENLYRKMSVPQEVLKYKPPVDYETLIGDVNLAKLNAIFKDVMQKDANRMDPIRSKFGNLEKDEINIQEKMSFITEFSRNRGVFTFRELLQKSGSKIEMVVTFLVVLEMMKIGRFVVEQEEIFGDINIRFVEGSTDNMDLLDI